MFRSNHSHNPFIMEALPSKKAYHHGNLRTALIEKALEIIREEGVAGLSLRKAARRVGVSHAAPGHHFGDMLGLLTAISDEGFGLLMQKIDRAVTGVPTEDPLACLKAICISYINFAIDHTNYFKVMYSSRLTEKALDKKLRKSRRKVYQFLTKCVVNCQRLGVVRSEDPMQMSLFVWTAIHGYATLAVDGQMAGEEFPVADDCLAEMLVSMICSGLQR